VLLYAYANKLFCPFCSPYRGPYNGHGNIVITIQPCCIGLSGEHNSIEPEFVARLIEIVIASEERLRQKSSRVPGHCVRLVYVRPLGRETRIDLYADMSGAGIDLSREIVGPERPKNPRVAFIWSSNRRPSFRVQSLIVKFSSLGDVNNVMCSCGAASSIKF